MVNFVEDAMRSVVAPFEFGGIGIVGTDLEVAFAFTVGVGGRALAGEGPCGIGGLRAVCAGQENEERGCNEGKRFYGALCLAALSTRMSKL